MKKLRCCFRRIRPAVILLLFWVATGNSQEMFGKDTASSSDDSESDRSVVDLLQKLSSRTKPSLSSPGSQSSTSALLPLHNVAAARFKKEMAMMFYWLPEPHKCARLKTITTITKCRMSDVINVLLNFTDLNHAILNVTCLDNSFKTRLKTCTQMNSSFVKETLYNELVNLFISLTPPFMCNIINNIALAYKVKGRRHSGDTPAMSISQAQNEVARILPLVRLPRSCADVGNSRVPTIPAVNLTVNLKNRDKKSWLDEFKKKGPEIYKIVSEYEEWNFHKETLVLISKQGGSSAINEELINDTRLFISAVNDGNDTFSVLFGLKVKTKLSGRLREMRSTHKIVKALRAVNRKQLNLVLGADVVNISLKKGQLNTTEQTTGSDSWSLKEINKANESFPEYLSAYYKQLEKPARCFIMFYISLAIKKTPKKLEMLYSSLGRFSRKHACYYTKRIINPSIPTIIEEIFTLRTTVISTTVPLVNSTEESDRALTHMSEEFDIKDVSALEITLFCLLGILCIAVVSFTINCVIFAFKSKSLSPKEPDPTTVLRTAVFHKGSNGVIAGTEMDRVHVTVEQKKDKVKPVDAPRSLRTHDVIKSCSVAALCERKSLSCVSQPEKKRMVLEMPVKPTSCLSSTNSNLDTRRVVCLGCPPTEQSHETVFVMLNCKGGKEDRV